jgi:hypothetical protein
VLEAAASSLNGLLSYASYLFIFSIPHSLALSQRFIIITKTYINDKMAFLKTLTATVALLSAVEGATM